MAKLIRQGGVRGDGGRANVWSLKNSVILYEERAELQSKPGSFLTLKAKKGSFDITGQLYSCLRADDRLNIKIMGTTHWKILLPPEKLMLFIGAAENIKEDNFNCIDCHNIKTFSLANGLECNDIGLWNEEKFPVAGKLIHSLSFSSRNGDVTEQIYLQFKEFGNFHLTLIYSLAPMIRVPLDSLPDFMAAVEKLDVSKLKPGVTH